MIRLVCQKYISACFQKNSSRLSIYHVVIPDHMIVGLESRGLIDFLSIHPPMVECLWKKNPDVIIKKSQMRRTKLAFWVHSHFSYRNLRLYLNKQIFLHSSLLLLCYYNCFFCEKSQFFNRHVWYRKRMSAKEKKFLSKKEIFTQNASGAKNILHWFLSSHVCIYQNPFEAIYTIQGLLYGVSKFSRATLFGFGVRHFPNHFYAGNMHTKFWFNFQIFSQILEGLLRIFYSRQQNVCIFPEWKINGIIRIPKMNPYHFFKIRLIDITHSV